MLGPSGATSRSTASSASFVCAFGEHVEDVGDARERLARALQRLDGIGEAGRRRVRRDGGDFGCVLGKCAL